MTYEEMQGVLMDIRKEIAHIRMNWSAAPTCIWFVDAPEFLDWAMELIPSVHPNTGATFPYNTIYGVPFAERDPVPGVPQGIWIEDRDGICHRVRQGIHRLFH